MPSALPVTLNTMNYASVVFVAGVTFAGVWYAVRGAYACSRGAEEEQCGRKACIRILECGDG
jgi:hypothetical protein